MVGNIYQTLVPFYGSAYYDEFHDYYTGSIHQRTHPKFVDRRVQNFMMQYAILEMSMKIELQVRFLVS